MHPRRSAVVVAAAMASAAAAAMRQVASLVDLLVKADTPMTLRLAQKEAKECYAACCRLLGNPASPAMVRSKLDDAQRYYRPVARCPPWPS